MVLTGVFIVMIVICTFVIPQLVNMYGSFVSPQFSLFWPPRGRPIAPQIPMVTGVLLAIGPFVPWALGLLLLLIVASPAIWMLLRLVRLDRAAVDLATGLPLIGPVLKRHLLARWLDAMFIATSGGLDLVAAIRLAGEAVASPALSHDGFEMTTALEAGRAIDSATALRFVPPAVPAAIELASKSSDLPATLATLSEMYQQQAEIRLNVLPALLTPLLLAIVGGLIGVVLAGLLLPLFRMLTWLSGGGL